LEKLDEIPALKENSFDVIVSNCVINLVKDKQAVLNHVYKLLKPGGEFYFSDVRIRRVK
jgi:arsenite methyltransferase